MRLDRICEDLSDIRTDLNDATKRQTAAKNAAIKEMGHARGKGGKPLTVYKHAGIELVLVPGGDQLRIHVIKPGSDVEVEAHPDNDAAIAEHVQEGVDAAHHRGGSDEIGEIND